MSNQPLLCYHNYVSVDTLSTDADTVTGLANLANPSTALLATLEDSGEVINIEVTLDNAPVSYFGIARHNIGSAAIRARGSIYGGPELLLPIEYPPTIPAGGEEGGGEEG
jgi:hypothetical protein